MDIVTSYCTNLHSGNTHAREGRNYETCFKYRITFLKHIDVMMHVNFLLGRQRNKFGFIYVKFFYKLVDLLPIELLVSQNFKF